MVFFQVGKKERSIDVSIDDLNKKDNCGLKLFEVKLNNNILIVKWETLLSFVNHVRWWVPWLKVNDCKKEFVTTFGKIVLNERGIGMVAKSVLIWFSV